MPGVSCDYVLFGVCYSRSTPHDTFGHILRKLNQMHPEGLREAADSGKYPWLAWRQGRMLDPEQQRRLGNIRLGPDLWARVRWVTSQNLQVSGRQIIERSGFPGYAFTVVSFDEREAPPERRRPGSADVGAS